MRFKHIKGVAVTARFAEENGLHYRYRMEIVCLGISAPAKTACVVMQNPSIASETEADKSVQVMEKVVFQQGLPEFQGVRRLIVVNQFARIKTKGFEGLPHDIGQNNDTAIKEALRESDIIILGWGSTNPYDERKAFVFRLLKQMPSKQLYKTKMHPSRVSYDGFIQPCSSQY